MAVPRIAFVMEQTLGHVTHDRNLRRWACDHAGLDPVWMPIEFDARDAWQRVPVVRTNWTMRASLRARTRVAPLVRAGSLDGLLFHTQVTSVFAGAAMRRVPTVVSLDATPLNLDTIGAAYEHAPSRSRGLEALKNSLNRKAFLSAAHLVTWCRWASESLVKDYGADPSRITVIPPGIDLTRWRPGIGNRSGGNVRLLFVGGDFRRKGGAVLLDAYRAELSGRCTLDIVTRESVGAVPEGVRVHHGLTANSPDLLALYIQADLFVFPTLGDCLPIAVMEAMAAGLPVVAARVGALDEQVVDGVTGFLVPADDAAALADKVSLLASDPPLREDMGRAGRARAEELFDGERNYRALIDLICRCAEEGRDR